MAKGSGGTRNGLQGRRDISFSQDDIVYYSIERPNASLSSLDFVEKLAPFGVSENEVKEALQLIQDHTGERNTQERADEVIIREIESGSPLGRALQGIDRVEREFYGAWKRSYAERQAVAEQVGRSTYSPEKELYVYRRGGDKDVQSWTRSSTGANLGNGVVLTPNRRESVTDMLKTHYVLGGLAHNIGIFAGEREVLFVKKKR